MSDSLPDLLDTPAAAALLTISAEALKKIRQRGEGPPFVRIGGSIRYSRASIVSWLLANEVRASHPNLSCLPSDPSPVQGSDAEEDERR